MKHLVFAVFDRASNFYSQPLLFKAKGEAIRSFTEEALSAKSNINRYASDYSLWHLGTYEDEHGVFENLKTPECLARAHEVIAQNLASSDNGVTH